MTKISTNCINLIKQFEGCKLQAYKPVEAEKDYTIGFGHKGPDVKAGMIISEEKAKELLKFDLQKFENAVNKYVKVSITQNQFDALVSFCYNTGINNFASSTLLKMLNANKFIDAANQFGRWVKGDNGQILIGLVKRRNAEKELFLRGTRNFIQAKTKNVKILASVLNIRAGAGENYKIIGSANKNSIMSVSDLSNGFYKISNMQGWICAKYVQII
jgi:lysozyme